MAKLEEKSTSVSYVKDLSYSKHTGCFTFLKVHFELDDSDTARYHNQHLDCSGVRPLGLGLVY